MHITLEHAQELAWEDDVEDRYVFVAKQFEGESRWTNDYLIAFSVEGDTGLYGFIYCEPATEEQEGMDDYDKFPKLEDGKVSVVRLKVEYVPSYRVDS